MIKVLGVSSSMRDPSFSAKGLEVALQNTKDNGAEVKFLKLSETPLPMFYSEPKNNENITLVTEMVKWADAFILATPDYHGSMSGSMKNFLDYYWSEFAGKLFGYICASHEKGLTAMDQMRTAIRQCYGWSVPYGVSIDGDEDFEDGTIKNSKLKSRLQMLSRDLVVYGEIIRKQFRNDLDANISNSFSAHYKE